MWAPSNERKEKTSTEKTADNKQVICNKYFKNVSCLSSAGTKIGQ
jgi:hypothetical protein